MFRRLLVSVIAAVAIAYAGTEALAAAIAPPPLKIIATVVAYPHPDSPYIARY
jgi:deoxyinosine 3'endonuclease (endonuclease V)